MTPPDNPPNAALPPDDRAAILDQLIRERDMLRAALPAHSIPPALLIRLEDLDDAIEALHAGIAAQGNSAGDAPA